MNTSHASTQSSFRSNGAGFSTALALTFVLILGAGGKLGGTCCYAQADTPRERVSQRDDSLLLGAPLINDGNLDGLTIGTNPDCDLAAGSWSWPPIYVTETVCEALPEEFQIVSTSAFDALQAGNSLMVRSTSQVYSHLPNVLPDTLEEEFGTTISVSFRIWIPNDEIRGCSAYMAGNHGGTGLDYQFDRGPQLMWISDGTIASRDADFFDTILLTSYPLDQWQDLRVDIDLFKDTFDIWWSTLGDPLILLGTDLKYRSGKLTHIDRFTVAHFWFDWGDSFCYIDDIAFEVNIDCNYNDITDEDEELTQSDFDADGAITLSDHWGIASCLSGPFSAPVSGSRCSDTCLEVFDVDLDGDIDLLDYLGFLEVYQAENQ